VRSSLTLGTALHRTRLPLTVWFWAAYPVNTYTSGLSAVRLQRQPGISLPDGRVPETSQPEKVGYRAAGVKRLPEDMSLSWRIESARSVGNDDQLNDDAPLLPFWRSGGA